MPEPAVPDWGGEPAPSSFPDPGRAGPLDADVAVGLLQRGQALADQGDWDLAAGTFSRVVGNEDPALHTAALLGLAECRYRLDDEPAALQAWISATQAPENPLTWRAWKALAVARVRSDDVPGAARAYREAGRRAPMSEQAEIQSRIGWLSKELGDDGSAERAFRRTRTSTAPQPVVTYALLGLTTLISLVAMFSVESDLADLLRLDKFAIIFGNEYWRLLTVALVHGSVIHLMFNMYALWIIGPIVEALYGPWRFLGIYLLCALAGSAASFATSPNPAVGASGAVFGLFGALLIADRVHKPALTRNARNLTMQIGVLIGINLLIGFSVPGIDNAAHIGGLLAGAALGFLIVPQGARLGSFWSNLGGSPERSRWLRLGGVAALTGVIVLVVLASPITWSPRDLLLGGQPGAVREPVGDAVGVAAAEASLAGLLVAARRAGRADGHGTTRLGAGSRIAQGQAPPDGDAVGEVQSTIHGATLGRIHPTEGEGP